MGYETLANMIEYNKEMEELGREESTNPTECPICGGALDENSRGDKSCPIDAIIWSGGIWR
uniref:Uncharacterized protein n=1 Tax=viral metagenome TaxID=1070528 RepID=A0A6M3ISU6_9ZZZZ